MAREYKWYVVWEGRATGVFNSWEECKLQVDNYPGAKYKSYTSQEDAINAFRGDYSEQMGILKSIALHSSNKVVNYEAIPEIVLDSIAVDASCLGNPGIMEYQGVYVKTGEVLFRKGPFRCGTNNIGEFLAIVHALALLKNSDKKIPIYSDSRTAQAWVRNRACKTQLQRNSQNAVLFDILERAVKWIQTNDFSTPIIKWKTDEWGEIPADFGRK